MDNVVTTSANPVTKPIGAETPTDALGVTKRMSTLQADGKESYECPTCDRVFDTHRGRSVHHKRTHGESIAGVEVECHNCGNQFKRNPTKAESSEHNFCDEECMHEWQRETWHGENAANWRGGKVTVHCSQCGDAARQMNPAQAKEHDNHFCSESCKSNYYNGGWVEREHGVGPGALFHTLHWVEGMSLNRISDILGVHHSQIAIWMEFRGVEHRSNAEANRKLNAERDDYDEIVKPAHKAVREAVENGEWHLQSPNPERNGYGEGWTEEKRELVREKYDRRCQSCGMSGKDSLETFGLRLDVHHIRPWGQFDDPRKRNAVENLVPLCRSCHRKWEGIPLRPEVVGGE